MPDSDHKDPAELERLNAKLTESLARCREIVADCRSKLAANGNELEDFDDKPARKRGVAGGTSASLET